MMTLGAVADLDALVPATTWSRMADKATREGIRAYRINDDPRAWAVTSHSSREIAYEVTILDGDLLCSCRGSAFHPYCKHRALVLKELGVLGEAPPDEVLVPHRVRQVLSAA